MFTQPDPDQAPPPPPDQPDPPPDPDDMLGADWADEAPEPSPATTTGTTSSRAFGSRKQIADALEEGVHMVTGQLNDLTPDPFLRENGVWLADDKDAKGVAEPVASIISRRGGLGAVANPDLGDAIAALIALAVYVIKQLNLRAQVRRLRNADAAPTPPDPDAEGTS